MKGQGIIQQSLMDLGGVTILLAGVNIEVAPLAWVIELGSVLVFVDVAVIT